MAQLTQPSLGPPTLSLIINIPIYILALTFSFRDNWEQELEYSFFWTFVFLSLGSTPSWPIIQFSTCDVEAVRSVPAALDMNGQPHNPNYDVMNSTALAPPFLARRSILHISIRNLLSYFLYSIDFYCKSSQYFFFLFLYYTRPSPSSAHPFQQLLLAHFFPRGRFVRLLPSSHLSHIILFLALRISLSLACSHLSPSVIESLSGKQLFNFSPITELPLQRILQQFEAA